MGAMPLIWSRSRPVPCHPPCPAARTGALARRLFLSRKLFTRRARRFSSCAPRGVPRFRGRSVARFDLPSGGSWGAVDRGDCGSSGCLAPGGRLVRRLCPGLPVPRAGWLDDCGSSGADIAHFDPQSLNGRVLPVDLPGFAVVRGRPAGHFPAMTRDHGPGRPAARGAPARPRGRRRAITSVTQTAANADLLPDGTQSMKSSG